MEPAHLADIGRSVSPDPASRYKAGLKVLVCLLALSAAFTVAIHLPIGHGLDRQALQNVINQAVWSTPSALFYSVALAGLSTKMTFSTFFKQVKLALVTALTVLLVMPAGQLRTAAGYVLQILLGLTPLSNAATVERITLHLGSTRTTEIGYGESIPLALCLLAYAATRFVQAEMARKRLRPDASRPIQPGPHSPRS
ncbi:MAG: hypothetical protein ABIY56_02685 [Dokdonella sp.]